MKRANTEAQNLVLWGNDPVLWLLTGKLKFSSLQTCAFLTGLSAAILYGGGWVADKTYHGMGLRFGDAQFLLWILILVLVFACTFLLYAWQPKALRDIFLDMERQNILQGVAKAREPGVKSYPEFLLRLQKAMNFWGWAVLSVLLATAVTFLELKVFLPEAIKLLPQGTFWVEVGWYRSIFLGIVFLVAYCCWMLILRQFQACIFLDRFFRWFEIQVYALHPDEAGGLGKIGAFALRTSLIILLIGFGAMVISVANWISSPGSVPLDNLFFWIVYLLLAPANFLAPMLTAHRAMQAKRDAELGNIAQVFRETLSESALTGQTETPAIQAANEKLRSIQARYELVASNFPTWPISARLFRNFSLTALVSLLPGLVSTVLDMLK